MVYRYFFKIAKSGTSVGRAIVVIAMAWKNSTSISMIWRLQLRDLSPSVFKKQVLPSLLDEGLALRTLNCNLRIYKSFAQLLYEKGWTAELFGAVCPA